MFGSQSIEPVNTIRGGVAADGGATIQFKLTGHNQNGVIGIKDQ